MPCPSRACCITTPLLCTVFVHYQILQHLIWRIHLYIEPMYNISLSIIANQLLYVEHHDLSSIPRESSMRSAGLIELLHKPRRARDAFDASQFYLIGRAHLPPFHSCILLQLVLSSQSTFIPAKMDVQLRDEAAQDRVRAATEFLDPSKCYNRTLKTSDQSPANT